MTQKEKDEKLNELNVQLAEAEKRTQKIRDELDELSKVQIEPRPRRWRPNWGQKYYFINATGSVTCDIWYNGMDDIHRFAIGNCFETEEEAKFVVERLKVIAKLSEFAEPDDRQWEDSNWTIIYSNEKHEVRAENWYSIQNATLYFESRAKANEAIKAVGIDRIKKYYLGVKEDSKATDEVKECEEERKEAKDEIKVGDEVDDGVGLAVIIGIRDDGTYDGIADIGGRVHIPHVHKKTGRHFPQIEEVIKQMNGK